MSSPLPIAFVTSRIRVEEKRLMAELDRLGVSWTRVEDADLTLRLDRPEARPWSAVWNRSLSYGRTLQATRAFETAGLRCFNGADVVATCGDKIATTNALAAAGVPTPRTILAFTVESALEAAEQLGYPCVIKPAVGSWGRLVARLDTRAAAEAVLEDRSVLGGWQEKLFLLQEYVDKPGRDARTFVVGDRCIAAIWRYSDHWITNTARGGRVEAADHLGELGELSVRAARAVGGGLLAVDVVETPDGLSVLEVNHSFEFRNSEAPTGVNIAAAMTEWVAEQVGAEVLETAR